MSLLHCVVGCSVFVLCVPSTLCCGLICDCVLCPFFTVLMAVQCCVMCPFYTVLLVVQCLCSVRFLHCVVGWSMFVFCVPSTLCCGLVGVLCPFYTVL